jgi:membrane protease YdiL (CAAX protease family)
MVRLQGPESPRMEAKQIEIKALLISLIAIFSIEVALRLIFIGGFGHPSLILGGARLLEAALIITSVMMWGNGVTSLGLARSGIVVGVKRGLLWSAGFGGVVLLSFIVLFLVGIDPLNIMEVRLPATQWGIALFFILRGLIGPVAEEIFFRGMLYGFFRRWGIVVALLISTATFVLAHPVFPAIPVPQLAGGIVFAVAYEVEGSLMAPIVIHVLGNLAIFTLSLIPF